MDGGARDCGHLRHGIGMDDAHEHAAAAFDCGAFHPPFRRNARKATGRESVASFCFENISGGGATQLSTHAQTFGKGLNSWR